LQMNRLHVSVENQMWQKRHTPCLVCTRKQVGYGVGLLAGFGLKEL
jgi:hypothetical protein